MLARESALLPVECWREKGRRDATAIADALLAGEREGGGEREGACRERDGVLNPEP